MIEMDKKKDKGDLDTRFREKFAGIVPNLRAELENMGLHVTKEDGFPIFRITAQGCGYEVKIDFSSDQYENFDSKDITDTISGKVSTLDRLEGGIERITRTLKAVVGEAKSPTLNNTEVEYLALARFIDTLSESDRDFYRNLLMPFLKAGSSKEYLDERNKYIHTAKEKIEERFRGNPEEKERIQELLRRSLLTRTDKWRDFIDILKDVFAWLGPASELDNDKLQRVKLGRIMFELLVVHMNIITK